MTQQNKLVTPFKKPRKELIDLSKLTKPEKDALSEKWYKEAVSFEVKLEQAMGNPSTPNSTIISMWNAANKLWKRVRIIEKSKK